MIQVLVLINSFTLISINSCYKNHFLIKLFEQVLLTASFDKLKVYMLCLPHSQMTVWLHTS